MDILVSKQNLNDPKTDLIQSETPQLIKTFSSLNKIITGLREKITPLTERAISKQISTSLGVDYLEVKYHLLLDYCVLLLFYLTLKARGQAVEGHPVVFRLLRARVIIEKLRPLDTKLQYQIEKLLKLANQNVDPGVASKQLDSKLRHAPNIDAFMEPETEEKEALDPSTQKYVVSKRHAVAYEGHATKKEKERERALKRAANSRMAKFVNEMVNEEPEEIPLDIGGDLHGHKKSMEEQEIDNYEEEYMVRLDRRTLEKQKKAKEKKKGKVRGGPEYQDILGGLEDFSHFAPIQQLKNEQSKEDKFSKALRKRSVDFLNLNQHESEEPQHKKRKTKKSPKR